VPEDASGDLAEAYEELGRVAKRNAELTEEVERLEAAGGSGGGSGSFGGCALSFLVNDAATGVTGGTFWTFGDGATTTTYAPQHAYVVVATPKTFAIHLTSGSCVKSDYIEIYP